MGKLLRDRRSPSELAGRSQVIDFEENLSACPRLATIVAEDLETLDAERVPEGWRRSRVAGRLAFGFADAQQRLPVLEGEVTATIDVVCQRCLEPMRLPLKVQLRLVFAAGAPTGLASEGYEVWELDDGLLTPLEVIEECLIMALPLAAAHEDRAECSGPGTTDPGPQTGIRPFADLKSRMRGND